MRFNLKLENIKYAKIYYKGSNGDAKSVKTVIKYFNEREILAFTKFNDEISEIQPQNVIITFICSDGMYKTQTELKKIENELPYLILVLKTPEFIEHVQNREFFRINAKYDCLCIITDDENDEYKEYSGRTLDISANGVCAIFDMPIITGANVTLRLQIENKTIQAKAKYVRSGLTEDKEYKISFSFLKISENDQDYISQICIKKQLEERRNSIL